MKYSTTMADLLQQVNEQRYEVPAEVGYKGRGSFDDVTIVVNARLSLIHI